MSIDYFAELYVAGVLAREGWNIYFPHRDKGFDFIISKFVDEKVVIRPVQVKGKYPESQTADRPFGFVGELTQLHDEMVLAIPYFPVEREGTPPTFIAYMPRCAIKPNAKGVRCWPARLRNGKPEQRRDYSRFFDERGIKLLESENWKNMTLVETEE